MLYLASSMLAGNGSVTKITDPSAYSGQKIELVKPKSFSYLRIVDPVAYGYVVEAGKLLQGTGFTE